MRARPCRVKEGDSASILFARNRSMEAGCAWQEEGVGGVGEGVELEGNGHHFFFFLSPFPFFSFLGFPISP
jgi:hypothetical protein